MSSVWLNNLIDINIINIENNLAKGRKSEVPLDRCMLGIVEKILDIHKLFFCKNFQKSEI